MNKYDYSIHYSIYHNQSKESNEESTQYMKSVLHSYMNVSTDSKILDIGCGFGFALLALKEMGFNNVEGLEISQEQADVCIKHGLKVTVDNNSIEWLLKRKNEFDVVILFDVLEHIPVDKQIDFVRAIYFALKSGGKILVQVPNANSILSSRWRYIDYTHFSSFSENSLYFVLKNAGFENINIENSKGTGKLYFRFWKKSGWKKFRRRFVRWCWLQVYKAEIPFENIDRMSFELNLMCEAKKI